MEDQNERKRALARAREKKYRERKGLISKAYKLPVSVVNDFAIACDKSDVYLNQQLMSMMLEFIRQTENKEVD